jgi:hypothetical protein
MSDRIEPIRRRTRGPAAVAGVAPLHDDDWRRRREDEAVAGGAAGSSGAGAGRAAPGGITRDDDGHVHVDFRA